MNKQTGPNNHSKKNNMQSQVTRVPIMNAVKVVPEYASYDNKSAVKQVDLYQPAAQISLEKFFFASNGPHPVSDQENETNVPIHQYPHSKDLKEVDSDKSSCLTSCFEKPKGGSNTEKATPTEHVNNKIHSSSGLKDLFQDSPSITLPSNEQKPNKDSSCCMKE